MRIAVLGATGVAGRHVVADARGRGHDVAELSRSSGVDVATGAGLEGALAGADAVIDVANVATLRRAQASAFFCAAARNVIDAATRAGVAHVVVLSIVGIDRLRTFGYYEAKLAQERLYLDGALDATVVRATQFHEFAGQVLARGPAGPVALVPRLRVQTVAARAVAVELVDVVLGGPRRGRVPDVAGPGPVAILSELARQVVRRQGSKRAVLAVPVPGAAGRAIAEGALLPGDDARLVGPRFDEWLAGDDGPATPGGAG